MPPSELENVVHDISFHKLQVFLVFLETGSLARAAERLQTSTVSVHRALHSLEEAARCALFRMQGRKLIPTEAALVLADVAREVLGTMDDGLRATRAAAGYADGRIRLGALYSLTVRFVPELILNMRQRRPGLRVELILGSNADLIEQLHGGSIDATLMVTPPSEPRLQSIELKHDELYFVAPHGSRFADQQSIDLRQLRDAQFVSLAEGFATQGAFRDAFAAAGFTPDTAMQVTDIFSMANMVSGGVGYALLPGRVRSIFQHKLQFIALAAPYRVQQSIALSFLRARERDPDLLLLASVCRVVAAAKSGEP
ncbi:MAG: LysR family transcriptional regulator [Rhodoferax sp.]|nr:LysR family transcriptional regulator [Rhodoferax sp.]